MWGIIWRCLKEKSGACLGKMYTKNSLLSKTEEHICIPVGVYIICSKNIFLNSINTYTKYYNIMVLILKNILYIPAVVCCFCIFGIDSKFIHQNNFNIK